MFAEEDSLREPIVVPIVLNQFLVIQLQAHCTYILSKLDQHCNYDYTSNSAVSIADDTPLCLPAERREVVTSSSKAESCNKI